MGQPSSKWQVGPVGSMALGSLLLETALAVPSRMLCASASLTEPGCGLGTGLFRKSEGKPGVVPQNNEIIISWQ